MKYGMLLDGDSASETFDGLPLGADGRPLGERRFRHRELLYNYGDESDVMYDVMVIL